MSYLDQIAATAKRTAWSEIRACVRLVQAPVIRTMREFAESEIVIGSGPIPGRFSGESQPYSVVLFDLIDSGLWNRVFVTGCVQSGKTLHGFVIPIMYHLFEVQENVICLVPDGDMAKAKWNDIVASIQKSRYVNLLPTKGAGSKGGAVTKIFFKNGTFLQFMTGGGSDKSRAGATARVVVVTEVDGMDRPGAKSRESDPITQVEARTKSFDDRKRIYGECTVSIEKGRTWQEWLGGTQTKLAVQCCKCNEWVTPDREHLIGWQEAENEIDARERSQFFCPDCGCVWTEDERKAMLLEMKPVHQGQSIIDGEVVGELPKTKTLSFRWNAFLNSFWSTGFIGKEEWAASNAENSESAEKERLQYAWAKPYKPDVEASIPVDMKLIMARAGSIPDGIVPPNTLYLASGLDLGAYWAHWITVAFLDNGTLHVVKYGAIKVNSVNLGLEMALKTCLHEFKVLADVGWKYPDGTYRIPDAALVDSGYQGEKGSNVVYNFINDHGGGRYWAADGRGTAEDGAKGYTHPMKVSERVFQIGEQYYIGLTDNNTMLIPINSNYWKSWVHKRLTTPIGLPGALALHAGEEAVHANLAKHLTAEREEIKTVSGHGTISVWNKVHKANHWFDSLYYACVGLHMAGARFIEKRTPLIEAKPVAVIEPEAPFVRPVVNSDSSGGWIRRRNAAT